ncbi:MAG: FAD-dependent monooxygenase, partial [Candidatus Limnocylindria bacterium]
VMSPFGARGLNSGVADAENLAWKLARAVRGAAPDALLDSYDAERRPAAVDNLAATDATMGFLAPHGRLRRAWRNLVLRMAPRSAWFRRRVDSGRLAEPAAYAPSPVIAPGPGGSEILRHGVMAPDVSLAAGGRLRDRLGAGFVIVAAKPRAQLADATVCLVDGSTPYGRHRAWLVRPDGYLADSAPIDDAAALLRLARRAPGVATPTTGPS